MADLNFYSVTEDTLARVPQTDGNIIFVRDSKRIILDSVGDRIVYNAIVLLKTENIRELMTPVDGFYFVEETNVLYKCNDGEWIQLTFPPVEQTYFVKSEEDLPLKGQEDVLYITSLSIYRYVDGKMVNLTKQHWESL